MIEMVNNYLQLINKQIGSTSEFPIGTSSCDSQYMKKHSIKQILSQLHESLSSQITHKKEQQENSLSLRWEKRIPLLAINPPSKVSYRN
jgi:hypothetical protein